MAKPKKQRVAKETGARRVAHAKERAFHEQHGGSAHRTRTPAQKKSITRHATKLANRKKSISKRKLSSPGHRPVF